MCSNTKSISEGADIDDELMHLDKDDDEYAPPIKRLKKHLGNNTQSYLSRETRVKFENMNLQQKLDYVGKLQYHLDLNKQQLVQKKTEIKEMKQSLNKDKEASPLTTSNPATCKDNSVNEKPGADYTKLMSTQPLELLEKQTNDENLNLIGIYLNSDSWKV